MRAKKIYESLNDFGFTSDEIVKMIKSKYGEIITIEIENEKADPDDCTDYLFKEFGNKVEIDASPSQIEKYDLGQSHWILFTIKGTVENVVDSLSGYLYYKDDMEKYIDDHIIL